MEHAMIRGIDFMTIEEMFARIRKREKITRGRFKGMLRRAQRSGQIRITGIPEHGPCIVLTDLGKLALVDLLGEVKEDVARHKSFVENGVGQRSLA